MPPIAAVSLQLTGLQIYFSSSLVLFSYHFFFIVGSQGFVSSDSWFVFNLCNWDVSFVSVCEIHRHEDVILTDLGF